MAVELSKARPGTALEDLRRRVADRISDESELVLAPGFFTKFAESSPRVHRVQILPKRGVFLNELTRFRYDVLLDTAEQMDQPDVEWTDWSPEMGGPVELARLLAEKKPRVLAIAAIPNSRVAAEALATRQLESDDLATVDELREFLGSHSAGGLDPEDLWAIARDLPYTVQLSWAEMDDEGRFDVLFRRRGDATQDPALVRREIPSRSVGPASARPWSFYANRPVARAYFRSLVPELKQMLQARLPDHMIPSAFVLLDRLPLTPNGKVDRRALPAPDRTRPELSVPFAAPRNALEQELASIFREVLDVEPIGIEDDFFELGGHSLKAAQVISRVRQRFAVEVSVGEFFASPTVVALSSRIDAAPARSSAAAAPRPIARPDLIPLSYAQQRLWFLDQLEPGGSAYNVPRAFRIRGPVDAQALRRALREIASRHESLRTSFPAVDGRPVQKISPRADLPLENIVLADLPVAAREEEMARLLRNEAERPFDLARGPLLRARLLVLSENEHILLLTMHHIVTDGWAMGVLFRELEVLYEAFAGGRASTLPAPSLQYADFAIWQRQVLTGELFDRQLAYWKEQLGGSLPLLDLPTDRPRPAVQRFRGAREPLSLPAALAQSLSELAQREGATLFMVLLAGFDAFLSRYTGQQEVVVGTPIANRNQAEIEGLIGFFTNTLVMRTDMSGDPSFRGLLKRVKDVALGAYAHQDVPFEKLVEELHPERTLAHNPLFQVMFVLQNAPGEPLELPGLEVTPLDVEEGAARFSLTLSLWETDAGLAGRLDYDTDLFLPETIKRMAGHFERLLASAVAEPDRSIGELGLMTEDETRRILRDWNDTAQDFREDDCVHERFERQAARTPGAVAAVFETEQIDYRELDRRSNQLARHLRSVGVGPEVVVGLCLDRSIDLVVGLLGILKAGGAYLPLDPALPAGRLVFFIQDAGSPVVVTEEKWTGRLDRAGARLVRLDRDRAALAVESTARLARSVRAENAAYVIYTSGSTGKPKGVVVEHRQIVNYIEAVSERLELEPDFSFALVSSLAADLGNTALFPSLTGGGTLHVLSRERASDAEAMAEYFQKHPIDCLKIVPSHLAALLSCSSPASVLPRKRLIFGGEALSWSLVDRVASLAPECAIFNHYGPTEATVGAVAGRVNPRRERSGRSVPLGRPLGNVRVYLLDSKRHPVPIGVPGELHIAGRGLARGYLNRPDLTNERFVSDPFAMQPGGRLYKTGDRARYRADGQIEFLGRIDDQVKIRGYRVEPREVEAILGLHPEVHECAVVARQEPTGEVRLLAFVVGAGAEAPDVQRLTLFLQEQVPDRMVPSTFLVLDRVPRTANGKVDRIALAASAPTRLETRRSSAPPSSAAQKALARVWSEVLGIKEVGIHENFFDLGGDSILSIQIVARAAREGLQVTPKQIFQHQTIASLAAAAGASTPPSAAQDLREGPVPLTPIQLRFFEQDLSDPHHYNQSVLLRPGRRLDSQVVRETVGELMAHHDAFRLRYRGVRHRQVHVGLKGSIPFETIDLSRLTDRERPGILKRELARAQASLDLSSGPVLRVLLFDLGPRRGQGLLIAIHHLVIDSVSWGIVLEDFETVYEERERGKPVELPRKTTSFQEWAQRLKEHADSASVRSEAPYWIERARAAAPPFPADFPDGDNSVAASRNVRVALTADQTGTALVNVPRAYRTRIDDLLLTALVKAFSAWTGEPSLLVDLEGHGREDIFEGLDLSRTVGWFTTRYPMLLHLDPGGPGAALKSMKEQLRSIPGHGIGYGLLRYLTADKRIRKQLAKSPQAQVSFNYLGQLDGLFRGSLFDRARESAGPERSRKQRQRYLIDINAGVVRGRFEFDFTYSRRVYHRATIEALAENFEAALSELITHCQSPDAEGLTPSDFPESGLTQAELDEVIGGLV